MKKRWLLVGVMLVAAMSPFTASANAGTGLMWASLLHLWIGNAIIGSFEGAAMASFVRPQQRRCVPVMIGANYFSAWAGGVGLAPAISGMLDWNLYSAWRHFWMLVVITYLLTLLLEWPFVAACFWRQTNWLKRSIKALLIVQTVSYLLLFGWYWGASGKSLYTQMNIVPLAEMKRSPDAWLFFISSEDGRAYEMDLGSQATRLVGEAVSTNHNDRLLFRLGETNAPYADLCLRRDARRDEDAVTESLGVRFSTTNVVVASEHDLRRNVWFDFGSAGVLGMATNGGWHFRTGFWPVEGMRASNEKGEGGFRFGWETPFSQWTIRAATHLPGDQVIFQLGENQICILDAPSRKVARITNGRGPAVALKSAEASVR